MFAIRGVIEGFYGAPWSRAARIEALTFLAARGANAYVYAPKDDPKHRHQWREPYTEGELDDLLAVHRGCAEVGVRFGFTLSPGLDADYGSLADQEALLAKLEPFAAAGVDWFVLAFDDVPHREGAEEGQAALVARVLDAVGGRVSVVPTDYVGAYPTPELATLCEALPAEVDVMWTGPTVVSPAVTVADATARAAATGGRPPLLWDNYPVNDAFMDRALHMGPLQGRDPGLDAACSGLLANPMPQARASLLALGTAMDYARDPAGYDPHESWRSCLDELAGRWPSLPALADACSTSALSDPRSLRLHRLLDAGDLAAVRRAFEGAVVAAGADDDLAAEVRPWLDQMAVESKVGLAALSVLEAERREGLPHAFATLGMLQRWGAARVGYPVVFGPRFMPYPAIVQDGPEVTVAPDLALVEDASAVDRLCRLALERSAP